MESIEGKSRECRRLRITGRVQGVCYRAFVRQRARALGLSGWVRNRPDGSVEAVAEGSATAIEQLIQACKDGPPLARVKQVLAHAEPVEGLGLFEIRA